MAVIENSDIWQRFKGFIIVNNHDNAHWLSDYRKYFKKRGDKHCTLKLQKTKTSIDSTIQIWFIIIFGDY